MSTLRHGQVFQKGKPYSSVSVPDARRFYTNSLTRLRLRISLLSLGQQEAILSRLHVQGLAISITRSMSETENEQAFDLEMRGTIQQIRNGLVYLQSLNITIKGKSNPDGDGWYC